MFHAVLLAGWLFMQGSPIVPSPPIETHTTTTVQVQAPPPDPKAIADASVQSAQAIVVQLIAPTLAGWVNDLLNVPDFIRTTPPDLTYNQSGVRGLAQRIGLIAGALIALAVFAVGLAHALGQQPSFGRLLFAVLLSFGDLVWWQWGIDLLNGINNAVTTPSIGDIIRPHLKLPELTTNPVEAFGPAVLVIVYAVVALLLLLSLAFRLGLIDILIVIGPLALLCMATDETQHWSQTYTRLAVGTTFSQVLVVVALFLAPILGAIGAGITSTLLGIVVLLLARQMPSLMASSGRSGGGLGRIGMFMLIRRVVARV